MTRTELADAIDPRKQLTLRVDVSTLKATIKIGGFDDPVAGVWVGEAADLIAASDALRVPPLEEVVGLVREIEKNAADEIENGNYDSHTRLIKAATALSTLSARVVELEAQIRRDDEIDSVRQAALDADQRRIAELETQVSVARALMKEEAAAKAYDLIYQIQGGPGAAAVIRNAIRALLSTPNLDVLVEKGARALYEETPLQEGGESIDGFEVSPTTVVTWAQIAELDGYDEIAADFRRMSRTIIRAVLGEG